MFLIFALNLGEIIQFEEHMFIYVSDGLKPPTRKFDVYIYIHVWRKRVVVTVAGR